MLELIKERMSKARAEGTASGFLIDGYPRELDQGLQFEKDASSIVSINRMKFFFLCD